MIETAGPGWRRTTDEDRPTGQFSVTQPITTIVNLEPDTLAAVTGDLLDVVEPFPLTDLVEVLALFSADVDEQRLGPQADFEQLIRGQIRGKSARVRRAAREIHRVPLNRIPSQHHASDRFREPDERRPMRFADTHDRVRFNRRRWSGRVARCNGVFQAFLQLVRGQIVGGGTNEGHRFKRCEGRPVHETDHRVRRHGGDDLDAGGFERPLIVRERLSMKLDDVGIDLMRLATYIQRRFLTGRTQRHQRRLVKKRVERRTTQENQRIHLPFAAKDTPIDARLIGSVFVQHLPGSEDLNALRFVTPIRVHAWVSLGARGRSGDDQKESRAERKRSGKLRIFTGSGASFFHKGPFQWALVGRHRFSHGASAVDRRKGRPRTGRYGSTRAHPAE